MGIRPQACTMQTVCNPAMSPGGNNGNGVGDPGNHNATCTTCRSASHVVRPPSVSQISLLLLSIVVADSGNTMSCARCRVIGVGNVYIEVIKIVYVVYIV